MERNPEGAPSRSIVRYVEPRTHFSGRIWIEPQPEALNYAHSVSQSLPLQGLSNIIIFWTDGSFKSLSASYAEGLNIRNEGGVGVVLQRDRGWRIYYYEGLRHSSINHAELRGIHLALSRASWMVQDQALQGHHLPEKIIIFSDSQWALGKIAKFPDTPNTSREEIDFFREQSRIISDLGVELELRWVPAHRGLPGNIEADGLSRHARIFGPSYVVGPSYWLPWTTMRSSSGSRDL